MDSVDLVETEGRLRRNIAGDLRARLDQVARAATAVYIGAASDTRHKLPEHAQATLRRLLIEQFDALADYNFAEVRADLRGAARDLIQAGAADVDPDVRVKPTTPLDLRWALTDLTAGMRDDLRAARTIVRTGRLERFGDLQVMLTAMRKAANRADRAAQWVTHRAHNEGRLRAAEKLASQGEPVAMLYRPERDACARCLSYAGSIATFGEPFEPTMQLADVPLGPIDGPWDQHPHCRCEIEPWFGETEGLTPVDLPVALQREAQRSAATGLVQGSEKARVRAADALLGLGEALLIPKTVQRRARKAVEAKSFPA